MAESIKGKAEEVGHKIAETASKVGHKISEGVEEAADWTKEKLHQAGHKVDEATQKAGHMASDTCSTSSSKESCGTGTKSKADIREHMDVIGSCGNKLGSVDRVEGSSIKLTKKDSPDGQHHHIPMDWVERVDQHVHLSKNCGEAKKSW